MRMNFRQFFMAVWMISCFCACKKQVIDTPTATDTAYYFPPLTGSEWERVNPVQLGWDTAKLRAALDWAISKQSYGMVILHRGRIAAETYSANWNQQTRYPLFSAGKSIAAFITGIAQQEGHLNIQDPVSDYLDTGWTSLTREQEQRIKIWHQLTMTTGFNVDIPNLDCTTPDCLQYAAPAGTKWYYHNAPYLLLHNVIANATGQTMQQYSKSKLFDRIGMNSATWVGTYLMCTTREAARFGSLIMNRGKWNTDVLLSDTAYFNQMVKTSQSLNPSYGYLWWLNGKNKFMVPTLTQTFNGSLTPDAPRDMIMALGKDDKKIYVIPSLSIVMVRLGDSAGMATLGPSGFDNEIWARLREAIGGW